VVMNEWSNLLHEIIMAKEIIKHEIIMAKDMLSVNFLLQCPHCVVDTFAEIFCNFKSMLEVFCVSHSL